MILVVLNSGSSSISRDDEIFECVYSMTFLEKLTLVGKNWYNNNFSLINYLVISGWNWTKRNFSKIQQLK